MFDHFSIFRQNAAPTIVSSRLSRQVGATRSRHAGVPRLESAPWFFCVNDPARPVSEQCCNRDPEYPCRIEVAALGCSNRKHFEGHMPPSGGIDGPTCAEDRKLEVSAVGCDWRGPEPATVRFDDTSTN